MSTYLYTAKNKEGENEAGTLEALNKHELAHALRQKGLFLISAEPINQKKKGAFSNLDKFTALLNRVSLVEKMLFSQHLSVMIKAGLSLNQALEVLANQTKNPKLKKIINQVENDVRSGQSFSSALSKYPKIFNNLYVSIVKVGETAGNLDEVLEKLAEQMRKDHELISRVKGAMMYPAVIIVAMIGIGIIMMITVVPKLTAIFKDFEMDLPLTTRIVIAISEGIRSYIVFLAIGLVVLFFAIRLAVKNKTIKKGIHFVYLRLPIFGGLSKKINTARFARTFSSLINSGVAIVESMQITAQTLGNIHFKESLINSAEQVQKGGQLSDNLSKYPSLYPPMVVQMVKVGEETGSLSDILNEVAEFYEKNIDQITKNLSSVIEPVIMVIVGAAVGFFAVSMLQPMYSMVSGV